MTLRGALLDQLAGGDRRSIGKAGLVVAKVLAEPERLAEIVAGLEDPDPVVRLRAADVAEKVSAVHPDWLAPHKPALLRLMNAAKEKELRWHLAQMAPRLPLDSAERESCLATLGAWLRDRSAIVQACSLQAMADLAAQEEALQSRLMPVLEISAASDIPALRARARRLLARLRRTRENAPVS